MANTSHSDISSERTLLNPGAAMVRVVTGYLSADTYPGQWVWNDASNNQWDLLDADTATHNVSTAGICCYEKRVNQSTNALITIDSQWDQSETGEKRAPICISGICVCFIVDQSGTVPAGRELMPHATAGSVTARATEATGATSGTALLKTAVGALAATVVTGDTIAIAGIGAFKGAIWGGPQ